MKLKFTIAVISAVVFCIISSTMPPVECAAVSHEETLNQLMKLLQLPQELERYSNASYGKFSDLNLQVQTFTFKTCNNSAPLQGSVTLSPDPVVIPGTVTVGLDGTAESDVVSPAKAVLLVKKKVIAWVTLPCIENIGSCTYTDVCSLIPVKQGQPCPPPFSKYDLPCRCPFKKGTYKLPPSPVTIPDISGLPEWLTQGDYRVNAKLLNAQNEQLACFDISVSLEAA